MINLHTNLSSLVVQQNLTQSTNKLNTAIERLTTGYKINHAGDNAANYSISTNMNTQLSSYDIAADNISMGMDLLTVAQDTIAGMQDRGSRLHALITQARNGTYGAASLAAMSQEAQALVDEINRLYINTEYNGIKIFDSGLPEWAREVRANAGRGAGLEPSVNLNPAYNETTITTGGGSEADYIIEGAGENKGGTNGFLAKFDENTPDIVLNGWDSDAINHYNIIGIADEAALEDICHEANGKNYDFEGKTLVLMKDMDMQINPSVYFRNFAGTFDGQGHTISGLDKYGLFGYVSGGTIKNLALDHHVIDTSDGKVGVLARHIYNTTITNCYAKNCKVSGQDHVGGLVGDAELSNIINSYYCGDVKGTGKVGGLAGSLNGSEITNSFFEGDVRGDAIVGGLVGSADGLNILHSFASNGYIKGDGDAIGGLVGICDNSSIEFSYSNMDVRGYDKVGGLIGQYNSGGIHESAVLGTINARESIVGSVIGYADRSPDITRYSYVQDTTHHHIGNVGNDDNIKTLVMTGTKSHPAGYRGLINGFVETNPLVVVKAESESDAGAIAEALDNNHIIGIGDVVTLRALEKLAGDSYDFHGKTIVLTDDINMEGRGVHIEKFDGTFDGNGHIISNFDNGGNGGLFGYVVNGAEIKNLILRNCHAVGNEIGLLANGLFDNSTITNCIAEGVVEGEVAIGGLVGVVAENSSVSYSQFHGSVLGERDTVGGLVGILKIGCTINGSYTTGNVAGRSCAGGLVGLSVGEITNSYSASNVNGEKQIGGLAGASEGKIFNSYATGNVEGGVEVGGLVGLAKSAIGSSYATGNVQGNECVGGLVGYAKTIYNSYATGNVIGNSIAGGLAGVAEEIDSSYSKGSVTGHAELGGLVVQCTAIKNSYATGDVSGYGKIGGLALKSDATNCFVTNSIHAEEETNTDELVVDGNLANCSAFMSAEIGIQAGINADASSRIYVDTMLDINLNLSDLTSDNAYTSLMEFLNQLSQKATEIGAAQNRLESALESTLVNMDNLTSSLSTIRDADIGKVSSDFIRQQILQQACATLMSTANQSPSIALQLL